MIVDEKFFKMLVTMSYKHFETKGKIEFDVNNKYIHNTIERFLKLDTNEFIDTDIFVKFKLYFQTYNDSKFKRFDIIDDYVSENMFDIIFDNGIFGFKFKRLNPNIRTEPNIEMYLVYKDNKPSKLWRLNSFDEIIAIINFESSKYIYESLNIKTVE